jgi:metal-sulfur cluster biosynthetic enzyme
MPESLPLIKADIYRKKQDMIARMMVIISCFMAAALVGCKVEKAAPHLMDEAGTLTGVLEIHPDPPVPMQDTTLQITLSDSGQPVQNAKIELTLTMPGCTMAPSFLEAAEIRAGVYQVQTVLTMAGAWQVNAVISTQAQSEELTFFFATR